MFLMTEHEGKQPGAKTTALLTAAQLLAKATANPVTYIHAVSWRSSCGTSGWVGLG